MKEVCSTIEMETKWACQISVTILIYHAYLSRGKVFVINRIYPSA